MKAKMDVPGFAEPDDFNEDKFLNEKKKESSKKGGGFQSMGLSYPVLKGITKRGYKIPTPIQRKAIPITLEGRDVVAMARTGSGKTASFLIPLFEKLKAHSAKTGTRALILSPTRELALQTLKFIKELGKFTGLKSAVVLGGDSMDDQFAAIHGNPDIIVATPGRFLHVCVEMDLKLNSIEYVVFDEADRLFEMGFGEQLGDIFNRLPDSRQTLLFSATLPKVLVEFAKAGLTDPVLIRLDVESKLPVELRLKFLSVRPDERLAALMVLLKNVINEKDQTVIFAATKHHVEYLHLVLNRAGISNSYIYSNLDPSARKINAAKFSTNKVKVLIVTDVAARGIDIPMLDNVINYNFPAKSKLFVHRVGRCARAGRSGTAYSLVSPEEYAYLLDLHLFLGKPLKVVSNLNNNNEEDAIGRIPSDILEEQQSVLINWHETYADLESMLNVCKNAYQQYCRSRPAASSDSNKRVKTLPINSAGIHPIFEDSDKKDSQTTKQNLLDKMKEYRPQGTVFEICSKNKSNEYIVMKEKRALHKNTISAFHQKQKQLNSENLGESKEECNLPVSNNEEINETFKEVVLPKKRKLDDLYKPKTKKNKIIKDENFIPYAAADKHTEDGYAVNSFQAEASKAQLDIIGDSEETQKLSKQIKVWDRKKKKMVALNKDAKSKKIRTESGVWIPATYKSNRYAEWKEKTKQREEEDDQNSDDDVANKKIYNKQNNANTHWARHNRKIGEKARKSELKTSDQILKARAIAEKKKNRSNHKGKNKKKQKKTK